MVSYDGVVYEKDLGPDTGAIQDIGAIQEDGALQPRLNLVSSLR